MKLGLLVNVKHLVNKIIYFSTKNNLDIAVFQEPLRKWFESYEKVCSELDTTFESRFEVMKKVNPKYILKNYIKD